MKVSVDETDTFSSHRSITCWIPFRRELRRFLLFNTNHISLISNMLVLTENRSCFYFVFKRKWL